MTVTRCAVIGNPINHSLSPDIHHQFAKQCGLDLQYEKILGDEQHFEEQVRDFFAKGGRGMNVTLPFKMRAFAMADVHSARASRAKASNTLWMHNHQLHADNTDGIGFVNDLQHYLDLSNKNLAILGAGGATRGILMPLLEQGLNRIMVINRSEQRANELAQDFPEIECLSFNELDEKANIDIVINASSAGTHGELIHVPECFWDNKPYCYDLSYQLNQPTAFVQLARQHGCEARDGLGMLIGQAAASFYIWHGLKPEVAKILILS